MSYRIARFIVFVVAFALVIVGISLIVTSRGGSPLGNSLCLMTAALAFIWLPIARRHGRGTNR